MSTTARQGVLSRRVGFLHPPIPMFTRSDPQSAQRARLRVLLLAPSTVLVTGPMLILLIFSMKGSHLSRNPGFIVSANSPPRQRGYIHNTAESKVRRLILSIAPTHLEKRFAQGAVGLSVEAAQLATQNLSANHGSLVALMSRLGPGSLRLGGNSLDYSWWTSAHERPPAWATSVVTPNDLIGLRKLLVATDWRAIIGVDLGHFDPTRAANEARVAKHILGSRLLGFEIGNEPDSYGSDIDELRPSSYGVSNYLKEMAIYSGAMRASAPKVRFYGPDLSSDAWLPTIAPEIKPSFTAITQHYYPTTYSFAKGICKSTSTPTAHDLLSQEVRERENAVLQSLVHAGQIAHRETRITETNTTSSCDANGGPKTSPVFASALWALDWVLRSASAGVTAMNFHSNFGLCGPETFSPMCELGDVAAVSGQVSARPEYYGLLAARELEGGRFVPVAVSGQNAPGSITTYATAHRGSVVTLAIDNYATRGAISLSIRVPDYHGATGEFLAGPSINATSGITFGNASFTADGLLQPTETVVPKVDGAFRIDLAPTSAAIITLHR
jgi:hypothetical protein